MEKPLLVTPRAADAAAGGDGAQRDGRPKADEQLALRLPRHHVKAPRPGATRSPYARTHSADARGAADEPRVHTLAASVEQLAAAR